MNKLEELQNKYVNVSAEIDRVRLEIQEEGAKANCARQAIAAIKQSINELVIQSKNVSKQRIGKGLSSAQIVESQKQLQVEMEQKQAELRELENGLFSSSSLELSGLLQNELSGYGQELSYIRNEIIKVQLESLTNEITDVAGEPLKKMALYLLTAQTPREKPDEIYRTIGVEICKKIFGEQNKFTAKLPSTFNAKQEVNELIGDQL